MLNRALRSYQNLQTETAVRAASPGELIVLVYDRTIEHLREAARLIGEEQDSGVPTQKALDLINDGLVAALDRERGGEIAENLSALYDWAVRSILRGRVKRDAQMILDVVSVLTPLRDAWVEANSSLKQSVVA